jgi:Xaa-Pro aminopeptidase
MGGGLFIDEAYYLYRATDSKDYGQEAIDILLQVMENDRDKLVVILAGYKDKMDVFFESNPGIGKMLLEKSSYYLSPAAEKVLRAEVSRMMTEPHFANARTVRNELELARLRHAHRISSDLHHEWNRDDLMRLEPSDILLDAAD